MALPSSSSASRWIYDAFLSFRGEDTRTNFTDHLYAALKRNGIRTFRDDDELERGEEIGPELLKAIENSRFSIIIFSKNYASSTWCLDELAHIIKCKNELGRTVLPVFYHVEPSDVRKQKRSFEEAFAGHEERFKEKMEKLEGWRDALRQAANLGGEHVRNGHESMIIDNIVKEISDKLNPKRLSTALTPVGLDIRADAVIELLYGKPLDFCIVGIYGMAGIGKTTIAVEVYNSIFREFEGSCFLKHVRENSGPMGTPRLQNQLLYEILKGKHEKIYNEDRGLTVIEERLRGMKVLIVLDDVDKLQQINKILGNLRWLSPGSRIIITTRIKNLLELSSVYRQYEVRELFKEESLRLLSINAFDRWHPKEEYMELAKNIVRYVGGNPLALIVLGSSLSGQSVDVWKSRLEKLRAYPDAGIKKILEISYHCLDDDSQKNLFLDIACFFIGMDKDYVFSILDGCGDLFVVDGVNTLIKRCLVKIGHDNEVVMHDLLRDMGREIVRQECPKEPGKRSRVWHHEEAFDLLTDKTGTKKVEGLNLNLPRSSELSTNAFRKMKRLRLLQLNNVNLTGSYEHISKMLRWLCWRECHLESLPADLHMENLVALDMHYSSLIKVWKEEMFLEKLKFLDLSHSRELTRTPNFKRLPNLEMLKLKGCTSLVKVHKSIRHLTKIVTLNLKDCRNLENLPRSIGALRSLVNLNISGCSKLDELPEELGNLESLVVFAADRTAISRVPTTFADLKNLRSLSMPNRQLAITSPMKGPVLISSLPSSLRELDLSYCNLSDDMIPDAFQNLPQLFDVNLGGNNFSSLPDCISLLPQLYLLLLKDCKMLRSIPKLHPRVRKLDATGCTSLERINPIDWQHHPWMELDGCHKLLEIEGFFMLKSIEVDFLKKLLETHGLSMEIESVQVTIINHLTGALLISPLQGFYESGMYHIFVRGNEIPSWFNLSSMGDPICFEVPPLQGHKILGFIFCAVYTWEECSESCLISPRAQIENVTKMITWNYVPKVTFLLDRVKEDIMWLSYWSINEIEIGEGNKVMVHLTEGGDGQLKKYGTRLLYQQNDQAGPEIEEPALIHEVSYMGFGRGYSQRSQTLWSNIHTHRLFCHYLREGGSTQKKEAWKNEILRYIRE